MGGTTWINRGHLYAPHVTPVIVDCNFAVTPTDGTGITNLKGQGVQNVFMHTSTTPSAGPNGLINPNPANGIIMVQLADNFSRLYSMFSVMHAPNGASTTSTVANVVNIISVLGTATLAQWLAVGLPPGVVPAVGVAFIATSSALIGGSAQTAIVAAAGSGIDHIEVCGVPALNLAPIPVGGSPHAGGFIYLQCMGKSVAAGAYTPAGTVSAHTHSFTPAGTNANDGPPETFTGTPGTTGSTTPTFTGSAASLTATATNALTAPATGTVIRLAFYLSQSSVTVAGE